MAWIGAVALVTLTGCGPSSGADVKREVLELQAKYPEVVASRDRMREVWAPLGDPVRSWTETHCQVQDRSDGMRLRYLQVCVLRAVDVYSAARRSLDDTADAVGGQRATPGALRGPCERIRIPSVTPPLDDVSWWIRIPKAPSCGVDVRPTLSQPLGPLVDSWRRPLGYMDYPSARKRLRPGTYVVVAIERRSEIGLGCGFGLTCTRPLDKPAMPSGFAIRRHWVTPAEPSPR
jgi:hypothetical protein